MGPLFTLDGVEGQIGTIGQSGHSKSCQHSILLERTSKDNGLLTSNKTMKEYTKFLEKILLADVCSADLECLLAKCRSFHS